MSSLIKILTIGDELVFDLSSKEFQEWVSNSVGEKAKEIKIALVDRGGPSVFLKVWADFSIKIHQFRQHTIQEAQTERIEITKER